MMSNNIYNTNNQHIIYQSQHNTHPPPTHSSHLSHPNYASHPHPVNNVNLHNNHHHLHLQPVASSTTTATTTSSNQSLNNNYAHNLHAHPPYTTHYAAYSHQAHPQPHAQPPNTLNIPPPPPPPPLSVPGAPNNNPYSTLHHHPHPSHLQHTSYQSHPSHAAARSINNAINIPFTFHHTHSDRTSDVMPSTHTSHTHMLSTQIPPALSHHTQHTHHHHHHMPSTHTSHTHSLALQQQAQLEPPPSTTSTDQQQQQQQQQAMNVAVTDYRLKAAPSEYTTSSLLQHQPMQTQTHLTIQQPQISMNVSYKPQQTISHHHHHTQPSFIQFHNNGNLNITTNSNNNTTNTNNNTNNHAASNNNNTNSNSNAQSIYLPTISLSNLLDNNLFNQPSAATATATAAGVAAAANPPNTTVQDLINHRNHNTLSSMRHYANLQQLQLGLLPGLPIYGLTSAAANNTNNNNNTVNHNNNNNSNSNNGNNHNQQHRHSQSRSHSHGTRSNDGHRRSSISSRSHSMQTSSSSNRRSDRASSSTSHSHSNDKRVSFPSGDKLHDQYIGLKKIGAGTFADIWEVYDQFDPKRKHWAIKVLKKSRCFTVDGKIDMNKYNKYTNAMMAEGNRILRLNKTTCKGNQQIIGCRAILYPTKININPSSDGKIDNKMVLQQIRENVMHSYGPCVVLELMGISLLQYTQLNQRHCNIIPLITVRCIAIQLLSALSFLHGVGGYIHADLKPENVLITLQHSINGNLQNNKYPDIKIVDLGNALSYNRSINTFEVQSLYYRAPEVLFGNEMTAQIDLWSIGCILFELVNVNKYNKESFFTSYMLNQRIIQRRYHHALFACCNRIELAKKIKNILSPYPTYVYNKYKSFYYKEIKEAFKDDIDTKLMEITREQQRRRRSMHGNNNNNDEDDEDDDEDDESDSDEDDDDDDSDEDEDEPVDDDRNRNDGNDEEKEAPKYKFELDSVDKAFVIESASYLKLKEIRKQLLIRRLNIRKNRDVLEFKGDKEFNLFIDLVACLLDLNPSTRYTSEDAIQHPFILDLEYVEHDERIITLLHDRYESVYPSLSISTDEDRQLRIERQAKQLNTWYEIEKQQKNDGNHIDHEMMEKMSMSSTPSGHAHYDVNTVPIPRGMTMTRKQNTSGLLYADPKNDSLKKTNAKIHSKVQCLFAGCCNNPTLKGTSSQQFFNVHNSNNNVSSATSYHGNHPPAKRFKYSQNRMHSM